MQIRWRKEAIPQLGKGWRKEVSSLQVIRQSITVLGEKWLTESNFTCAPKIATRTLPVMLENLNGKHIQRLTGLKDEKKTGDNRNGIVIEPVMNHSLLDTCFNDRKWTSHIGSVISIKVERAERKSAEVSVQ
jgi:hypothetical protein